MADNVSSKMRSGWHVHVAFFIWFWINKGTYAQQVAVDISFLTKDSHDVWSKLTFFLTVLLKHIVCD